TVVQQISGNRYIGTGVQLRFDDKRKLVKIVVPFRRGPARKAGARPGDLIIKVNDVATKGMSLEKVVTLLRGDEGTKVTVEVRQPGAKQTRTLQMTRSVVPFDSVYGYRRASEEDWKFRPDATAPIAYLWVKAINSSTLHDLRKLERRLKAEGARALVLDLRF